MVAEKCFTQRFMEAFGLEFPKNADRFVEIFTRFAEEGGMFGQLIDELVEAFQIRGIRYLICRFKPHLMRWIDPGGIIILWPR
jgi:hypothetical protein